MIPAVFRLLTSVSPSFGMKKLMSLLAATTPRKPWSVNFIHTKSLQFPPEPLIGPYRFSSRYRSSSSSVSPGGKVNLGVSTSGIPKADRNSFAYLAICSGETGVRAACLRASSIRKAFSLIREAFPSFTQTEERCLPGFHFQSAASINFLASSADSLFRLLMF